MRSRILPLFATALLLLSCSAAASPLVDPLQDFVHLGQTPAAQSGAASAFANPAAWGAAGRTTTAFWWTDRNRPDGRLGPWGFSWGGRLGMGLQRRTAWNGSDWVSGTDLQIGFTWGDRAGTTALAWRTTRTDHDAVERENALVLGRIARPAPWLALGGTAWHAPRTGATAGLLDLAIRPLGDPALTLFAQYDLLDADRWDGGRLGFGAALQPVKGLRLSMRLREAADDWDLVYSAGITLRGLGFGSSIHHDDADSKYYAHYVIETDGPRAPLPAGSVPLLAPIHRRIVALNLENRALTYQKYRWFDDVRVPWLDLLRVVRAVGEDDGAEGVALNLAGFRGRPSLIWELHDELQRLKDQGKTVHIHLDRAGMALYGLASVADRLTIDPEGGLTLPGVDLSRTYLHDLVGKVGLGFKALQYFDHKTAVEVLSRTDMSPADREQRGRIVELIYAWVRDAAAAGRGFDPAVFDAAVDQDVLISAHRALELGLVDELARWHDLGEHLAEGGDVLGGPDPYGLRSPADERWGEPPVVAVVYAVGECAMDTGIRGRRTGAHLRALADDPSVKAVVLRADSPGGDPLPSDLVAEGVRKLREAGKPVIVSQGDVAASGGYWISMNGTEILTTPLTITGSIGVIAGWVWDESLHEKAGVNADGVSQGAHADLFRNVRYPLLNVAVPARAMTEEEETMARDRILEMYGRFVDAVAAGRDLEPQRVRDIGGGRVWMGPDAVDLGLCDGIGGLGAAVDRARELAGIAVGERVRLREYPPRPLVQMPRLGLPFTGLSVRLPGPWGQGVVEPEADSPDLSALILRRLAETGGRPLLFTSPDALPDAWRSTR